MPGFPVDLPPFSSSIQKPTLCRNMQDQLKGQLRALVTYAKTAKNMYARATKGLAEEYMRQILPDNAVLTNAITDLNNKANSAKQAAMSEIPDDVKNVAKCFGAPDLFKKLFGIDTALPNIPADFIQSLGITLADSMVDICDQVVNTVLNEAQKAMMDQIDKLEKIIPFDMINAIARLYGCLNEQCSEGLNTAELNKLVNSANGSLSRIGLTPIDFNNPDGSGKFDYDKFNIWGEEKKMMQDVRKSANDAKRAATDFCGLGDVKKMIPSSFGLFG